MPRKAKSALARQKLAKNTVVTMEIMENYLEPHFVGIQEEFTAIREEIHEEVGNLRKEVDQRFAEVDRRFSDVRSDIALFRREINEKFDTTIKAILAILSDQYKSQQKDIKTNKEDNWSLEKRVQKLEKHFA